MGDLSRKVQSVAFHNAISIDDEIMGEIISGNHHWRDKWNTISTERVENGEPYLLFTGNANKNCPEEYVGRITQSNLCVAPETKILTSKGYLEIGSLENKEVEVWNGEEFSKVTVRKTGQNQAVIKVKTKWGQEIECTPYHKFYVQTGYLRGTGPRKLKIEVKRASELKVGDKLIKFKLPTIEGSKVLNKPYVNGFYTGDGTKLLNNKQRVYLYGEKRKLIDEFKGGISVRENGVRLENGIS